MVNREINTLMYWIRCLSGITSLTYLLLVPSLELLDQFSSAHLRMEGRAMLRTSVNMSGGRGMSVSVRREKLVGVSKRC